MKRKGLYIILALSITCTMFTACKKNDSVESANVVEEKTDIIESESVTEEIETTTSEEVESTVEVVESTEETETVEEEPTTEETETREGTEGDSSAMDIETPESKPTPESITPQSSVEDMIAAYPDEITPELQDKLDSITNYYEQDLLPEEFYKEDIYNTLYGPSQEELQAELERLLQGATTSSGSTQNSETEIPDALKDLITTGQGDVGPAWDNYQGSGNFVGVTVY